MMKKKFSVYAFFLMAALLTACQSAVNGNAIEDELARIEALLHANDTLLLKSDSAQARYTPGEELPTPLEWCKNVEGTGPWQPIFNYFEVVKDYSNVGWAGSTDPGYNHYIFFELGLDHPDLDYDDYWLQIQYTFQFTGTEERWEYIRMPDNDYGLVDLLGPRRFDIIPAFAFPYSNAQQFLYLRMRTVRKDFAASEPNSDTEGGLYDRNMFSPWAEETATSVYYNPFGFGKPQPDQNEDGDTEPDDPIIDDSNIQVTVYFPVMDLYSDDYSFSYTVTNNNMGYTEILDPTQTNFLGIGKNVISNIGSKGGFIEVFATCTNKHTKEYAYCNKIIEYGPSEKNIIVEFYGYNFDNFFDPDDDDW